MFRLSSFALMSLLTLTSGADVSSPMDKTKLENREFIFDADATKLACQDVKKLSGNDEEQFRLYCINTDDSFENCAISCSKALQFESTVGDAGNDSTVFHNLKFILGPNRRTGSKGGETYSPKKGIPTVLAVIPLWNSQGQYMYELLETLYSQYNNNDDDESASNNLQVIGMPMLIEDALTIKKDSKTGKLTFSGVQFEPHPKTQNVQLLQMTTPQALPQHPLLEYLQSLHYVSGYQGFDVYVDRPVIFIVDSEGQNVERLVIPTLEELSNVVDKYMPSSYKKSGKGSVAKEF